MEVSRIPRITLDGDEESAGYMAREGIRQLGILKGLMSFNNLQQDIRRVEYIDGSRIICRSCFGEDVVYIYVPEEEPEKKERLPERFYCLLVDGVFKWIIIRTTDDGSYIGVLCKEIIDANDKAGNPYCMMVDQPYFNEHGCFKAFILDEERYVASLHLLTCNREIVFRPLDTVPSAGQGGMPRHCDPEFLLCKTVPPTDLWMPRCRNGMSENELEVYTCDLSASYPANRFLVNNNLLTWYHAREGFLFGVCIKLKERTDAEKLEIPLPVRKPERINSFITKWHEWSWADIYFGGPLFQIQVGMNPHVPINMVPDISETTEEYIEQYLDYEFIRWDGMQYYTIRRPVKIKKFFDKTPPVIEIAESTEHWYWSDSGFEKKVFFEIAEYPDEGRKTLGEDSGSIDRQMPDCEGYGTDQVACVADNSHAVVYHEDFTYRLIQLHDQAVDMDFSFFRWSSDYIRNKDEIEDFDKIRFACCCCFIAYLYCRGCGGGGDFTSYTLLHRIRDNNYSNALVANWESNNVARVTQDGSTAKVNCKNTLTAFNDLLSTPWPWEDPSLRFLTWAPWVAIRHTHWGARDCPDPDCYGESYAESKSWLGGGTAQWWKEKITPEEETLVSVGLYDFDGMKRVPVSEVEKYWYLDDLATDESQGFMLAIKKSDGSIEFHHRFKDETGYRNITLDIFKALDLIDEDGILLKDKIIEVGLI